MKILEAVNSLNEGKKMPELAKELGTSKDTLRKRLNDLGYKFNNSSKEFIFLGKKEEKDNIDNLIIEDIIKSKRIVKSEENQKKIIEKEENDMPNFTEKEILFLKKLAKEHSATELRLFIDLAHLPSNFEQKKSSISISQQIHDEFEEFSKKFDDKRISKNTLIELALTEFMNKHK
ncbi:hypothetical protein M3215_22750 [Bacillus cytotoxicus]|uniref:Uncharacterized protein n=1 Tax=Bacillus cytotoxicus TaxID=580165 RepID=A0ACC6ADC1_9BACI|nr:hypothetical protein [Bacillus cytotoxicus]